VSKPCTKLEICNFGRSEDISWGVKVGHVTLTTSLWGRFVTDGLGHVMTNKPTKFEVPNFAR